MLLTKRVKIKWSSNNRKWYENKGYIYTKYKDEFEVNTLDLMKNSHIKIKVKCDCCNEEFYIEWRNYIKQLKNDLIYCLHCSHKICSSEKSRITRLKNSKSFKQWCLENNFQNVLERWDYDLNSYSPDEINYTTHQKYYFKCPKGIHKSELQNIHSFVGGENGSINCKACNSFAQWGTDNICVDFLKKYWDYAKNEGVNPWKISYGSQQKIWIRCQEKDYHESYQTQCNIFIQGSRCPYCRGLKVHQLDSLGYLYPQTLDIWSDKNKKSAFEYTPMSHQTIWLKCPENKHEDYLRRIESSVIYNFRCPECQFSKGEKRIEKWLKIHNIINIPQKEFAGLIGLGNGNLSYDFYLPDYNFLIEYQGEYHDGRVPNQTIEDFIKQQEHDRRKKQYCIDNNINLLEIWYWDYDNIEKILNEELN